MDDDVRFCHALSRRDIPPLGGRLYEHQPRGGAGLAHDVIKTSDRMRSVCVLIPVTRVAYRLLDFQSLPVGVQLVGNYQRQRSANSRAHLGAMRDDVNRSVRIDSEKYAGMQGDKIRTRILSKS